MVLPLNFSITTHYAKPLLIQLQDKGYSKKSHDVINQKLVELKLGLSTVRFNLQLLNTDQSLPNLSP